jgi:hypothetical protein
MAFKVLKRFDKYLPMEVWYCMMVLDENNGVFIRLKAGGNPPKGLTIKNSSQLSPVQLQEMIDNGNIELVQLGG